MKTTIRLHAHPFEAEPPRVYQAESIGQWLLAHYGEQPGVEVHVYAGEPSLETDLTGDVPALMRNDASLYVVLEAPGADPVSILASFAISTVIGAISRRFFAPGDTRLDTRAQESPNNALSARENRQRILQRVEDIFGTVRSIPSLMMPTYQKYISHRQVEYGYYCIGRGWHDVADIRDGDTLLAGIRGASAAVYAPFTSPNAGAPIVAVGEPITDPIVGATRSSAVDGIVLKPVNQLQIAPDVHYYFRGPGPADGVLPATTLDLIYQPAGNIGVIVPGSSRIPNFAAVVEEGQTLTISMPPQAITMDLAGRQVTVTKASRTYAPIEPGLFKALVDGSTIEFTGTFQHPKNLGPKTVVSHTLDVVTVAEDLDDEIAQGTDVTMVISYSGVRTVAEVGNGYVTLAGPSTLRPEPVLAKATITVDNGLVDWTDWYTLPDEDRAQVWTNVVARAGMYKDDGSKHEAAVDYELQIEQLDALLQPTGVVETVAGHLFGSESGERGQTLEKVTGWTGPARVRARRLTPFDYGFNGFVQDEITWTDLYAVWPVDKPHFGNKTTIHTVTHATQGAARIQGRQLNCLASRKLPTYDGVAFSGAFNPDGSIAWGTIHPTSRIVDILAAVTVDPVIGARPIEELDLAQVWGVQQALDDWNEQCGQFNYTFDSDEVSYEETAMTIAGAAFCRPFRQNGQIRLALDRPQADPVALLSHRNKKPRAETITRRFASDSDYDGVELAYMDPDTETQETIRLPLGGAGTKLRKIEVSGIRSYEQAWYRANREYQRQRLQRLDLETECTVDARALLPNSRILVVDNTRLKAYDGEVVGQAGLELTLSRDVAFEAGTPHSVVLQKRDGSTQAIAVTPGAAANRVVLAAPPAEAIVTEPTPEAGIRTIFSFAADSARAAQAWLVTELELAEDRYVRVRAVNYDEGYYAADALPAPPKAGVIN